MQIDFLEPLWKVLEDEEEIDLDEAIKKSGLKPYDARMSVRRVLMDFTIKWKRLIRTVIKRKAKIIELSKSEVFGKIILLEKCENSKLTPEGLDLHLWFEKLRYCKTVGTENPLFSVNNPISPQALNYLSLLEKRNGGKLS